MPVVNRDGLRRGVDLDAAERAAADFLTALGIDLDREERRATPSRMARGCHRLPPISHYCWFFRQARLPEPDLTSFAGDGRRIAPRSS